MNLNIKICPRVLVAQKRPMKVQRFIINDRFYGIPTGLLIIANKRKASHVLCENLNAKCFDCVRRICIFL